MQIINLGSIRAPLADPPTARIYIPRSGARWSELVADLCSDQIAQAITRPLYVAKEAWKPGSDCGRSGVVGRRVRQRGPSVIRGPPVAVVGGTRLVHQEQTCLVAHWSKPPEAALGGTRLVHQRQTCLVAHGSKLRLARRSISPLQPLANRIHSSFTSQPKGDLVPEGLNSVA